MEKLCGKIGETVFNLDETHHATKPINVGISWFRLEFGAVWLFATLSRIRMTQFVNRSGRS